MNEMPDKKMLLKFISSNVAYLFITNTQWKENLSTAAGALCTVRPAILTTNFKSSVQLIKISILEINLPFFFQSKAKFRNK